MFTREEEEWRPDEVEGELGEIDDDTDLAFKFVLLGASRFHNNKVRCDAHSDIKNGPSDWEEPSRWR